MNMIEMISNTDDFEALAPEWDDLVRAMPRPSPFLLHGWLTEWYRHYAGRAELNVHVARRDGRLVGALPLVQRRRAGLRVATFIGGSESALRDILLAAGEDGQTCEALARRLAESCYDVVDLHGLPAGSRIAAALGPRLEVIQRVEAPVLDIAKGWDAVYRAKTSSKKRSLHRRRRRQLAELGTLEVSVARSLDELQPALEEAFELHARRWEGRPDGSGFVTATGRRFHRATLRRLAAIDVPRIVTLRLAGRAIAFHYFFALEGCMYVHRLAFDPALSRFSPGVVNTLDAIEAAAHEGVQRVEFLGGDERYKLELADRFEPLCHGFGVTSSARGRAYAAAHVHGIRLRMRLKRSPRLRRLYFDGVAPVRRLARRSRALRAP
jgi:CelD/BcsL family acetyltransferase involved in cellulose biosynthesis